MKAKNLCTYAGLCAGFASMAVAGGDKPTPQLLGNAINVQPVRIAKASSVDGKMVQVGEWMDYKGGSNRAAAERVFDCFGDSDSDGFMDDTGGCALSSSRWYFGTLYCNGFATNDMHSIKAKEADGYCRADFGWYWTCGGFGSERCIVFIFTQESVPCAADSFDYSGWLLDYGSLTCNPGGYYYSNVDISATGSWVAVTGGDGSYIYGFGQDVTTGGAIILATCAQPMLWGDLINDSPAVNGRGEQETEQYDDDNPLDGSHTTTECYTYSYGLCPDPLGAMLQFWGTPGGPGCYADFNGDGLVDTRDVLAFLNAWNANDPRSDCNGDGLIDTRDVLCFLNLWNAGC
jgi:hypothetical protein